MSQSLTDIATQIRDTNKKVQLIYAFNGSGKTRLSRAFKELVAPKAERADIDAPELSRAKILYYNAFTEDLFYWDNDLEADADPRLKIQPNSFTEWVLKEQGQDRNVVANFQRYTNDKLTPHFDVDFAEVTFSLERGDETRSGNLKISKGEESSFIWSIFYTLLEQVVSVLNVPEASDRETDQFDQLEYVFIDDPVSSLDENHLIQLAVQLAGLILQSSSDLKFAISTHSPLFYNVLYSELDAKMGNILRLNADGSFAFEGKQGHSNQSFSYHLYLKQLIEEAIAKGEVQRFHFTLLRNLYEKVANFLGYSRWSALLPGDQALYAKRVMHFYSHRTLAQEEVAEPTEAEKQIVKQLLDHLVENYGFWKPVSANE